MTNEGEVLLPFLVTLSFFSPDGLSFVRGMEWLESAWRLANIVLVLFLIIRRILGSLKGKGRPFDGVFALICVSLVVYLACTIMNNGSIAHLGQKALFLLGAWLLVTEHVENNAKHFIIASFWALFFLSIANILGIVWKYPESFRGIGDFWLFGQRNAMRNMLFPALLFSLLRDRLKGKKMSLFTVYYLITLPILLALVQSMTSLVLALVLDVLLILSVLVKGFRPKRILPAYLVVYALMEVVFVFIRKVSLLENFIVNTLHRSMTFSGRTEIWDLAISKIQDSLFVGTGAQTLENAGLWSLQGTIFSHCHNGFLDLLYKGGVFMAISVVALFAKCIAPLLALKDVHLRFVLGAVLGSFIIAGVFGDLWHFGPFEILFLCAYSGFIEETYIELEQEKFGR